MCGVNGCQVSPRSIKTTIYATQFAGVARPDNKMGGSMKDLGIMAAIFLVSLVQMVWANPYTPYPNLGSIKAAINANLKPGGVGVNFKGGIDLNHNSGIPNFPRASTFRPVSYGLFTSDLDNDFNRGLDSAIEYDRKPVVESRPEEKALSCESNSLKCVPKADCSDDPLKGTRQCPPMWKKIGGACYFIPNYTRVRLRSQPEARQYCKDIGGNLAWIETEYDKKAVNDSIDQVPYWTDGVYNQKKGHWYWESNWLELVFKKLDGGMPNNNPAIASPSGQRLCLSIDESGFMPSTCYERKSFVCKMGKFDNRCEKSLGRCCWSPSYQYYYTNLHGSSLTSSMESGTKGSCFVLFNGEIITCAKAYEELKNLPTFRIGKSIYYLNSADAGCSGTREAIIPNEEIHSTIVRFLMTVEKLNIKIKIGLMIKATDTGSTLLWVNGKSHSYYKNEYWAVGHPMMHGLSGCVMYSGTGTDGSGTYLWYTIDNDAECANTKNMVLCEVPIRNTDFQPVKRKQTCGIRFSGGVLGRSYSFGNDHEEARFGEWPWQAAILNTRNFHLGVGQEFACSGALLSHDVVLTSAHCVQGISSGTLMVSLGDFDLEAVNQRKLLNPQVVKVREVVIHPDYDNGANDLAILHLTESVAYLDLPHINVGCLPSQRILYAGGDWECFVTGWPQQSSYGSGRRLQRVEVDFVPRRLCSKQTRRKQYDAYGRPIYTPNNENTINNKEKEAELLCVEPWDTNTCLADSTMMLVCKKNAVFNDDPFNLGDLEDSSLDGHITTRSQQQAYHNQQDNIQSYMDDKTRIINAYGQNRFNADKWYVIGVGHESNSCSPPGYMIFTPVHEYLYFIQTLIDETSASSLDSDCQCLVK